MKKIFFFSLLFSIATQFVLAQLTPAEIQKKAEEAIKKAEQLKNDPKVKAAMEKAKQNNQQPAMTPKDDSLPGIPENIIALTKPEN
jgi:ABC-type transporter MlaC component